ncbi:hypothetical protein AB0D11_02250 [Streptomyces monashensis]|uniref:hypothetical protein n=1 Tax=Streptomyces monashensis TaxID=1678012 RepID=UPI003407F448
MSSARTWRPGTTDSLMAPAGVRAVTDRTGKRWTKRPGGWTTNRKQFIRWRLLVERHGPVTEAT